MRLLPPRSLRHRLGTTLAVILVCLVTAELALRLTHWLRPSPVFEVGALNRFRGRPHAPNYEGRLNALGFNDREFGDPKPAGAYRVAAIGDSFVFGVVPYPHNFLTRLEERLAAEGRPVEILNLGLPGTGLQHQQQFLATEAIALRPDAVLQFVYIGNDFTDMGLPQARRWSPFVLDLARFLLRVVPPTGGRVFHPGRAYHDDGPSFTDSAYEEIVRRHAVTFDPAWERFPQMSARLQAMLRRTAAICRARELELAVVLMPAEIQVGDEIQSRLAATEASPMLGRLDLERPNRALGRALAAEGIPYLDLLPGFAAAARQGRLYKPNDTHWNIAGNLLAAELLHDWLVGGDAGLELPPPAG